MTAILMATLAEKEGQRVRVPEGGELVCYRNNDDRLTLKVEYSREMMVKLSSSIFCHQRPSGFAKIAEEIPELLGLPMPIPSTPEPEPLPSSSPPMPRGPISPLHLYSPLRGPVTMANESMRLLSIHREFNKRMHELSLNETIESPSSRFNSIRTDH